jgi:hypothetical protein
MGFLFIKILLPSLSLKLRFIFTDESKFTIKNSNFRTCVAQGDFYHYGNNINEKVNIILDVSEKNLIHFELTEKNINSIIFKNFFIDLLTKIKDKNDYIFIMDNSTSHTTKKN